ncbi:related to beta-glucosidase [Ramularia collo-cygni]|uniref:Related to beta-glucosidase n=1 Tax=Ramularia collo-cygni TaxID=112498 RepID=A0A2D3V1B6_9PEZI|nr:related to beta-glucosidase [Ramularia collo-cygni]CZT21588.1 related to beta-glucosidase [Ramularia collo-cygni]
MASARWITGLALSCLSLQASAGDNASSTCTSPDYHQASTFSYPQTTTRFASSNPAQSATTTYALPYGSVSAQFANLSTTTWPNWTPISSTSSLSNSTATATATATEATPDEPYGTAAFTSLWNAANPVNFTRGMYSTTVSPTPIPSSELALPPPLVFQPPSNSHKFPKDFFYGAAGSAAQCEGAIADHGKTPSRLDMYANVLSLAGAGSFASVITGGASKIEPNYVTNEHYYLYKQDIERMASMGLKTYSFSIPWTRILPFALPGTPVNEDAISHYSDMIDFVLEKGMQPVVTLFHFDTPLQFYGGGQEYILQYLQTKINFGLGGNSGFSNATFEDAYVHYATLVMSHYADRVPYWITINEPQASASNGVAVNTVLRCHSRVVHYYREVLQGIGKVSLKMGVTPGVPADPSNQTHVEAANFFSEFYLGPFLRTLGLGLDYPENYKQAVSDYIPLSSADLAYMKGTIDFIALDAYTAPPVFPASSNLTACAESHGTDSNITYAYPLCLNLAMETPTGWAYGYDPSGNPVFYTAPSSLRTNLNYIYYTYGLPIVITEFGLQPPPPPGGQLRDNLYNVPGSEYTISYLSEMLKAIWEDGVKVLGAINWNWGDSWEFGRFDEGYGLMFVDHTTQERRYRRSFFDAVEFVESRREEC